MDIYIDGNYSNIRFSAAHFIPGEWKCSRIHGHDYSLSVKITGDLNDKSYFLDFSEAKGKLRDIADFLDHRVLIPGSSHILVIKKDGKSLNVMVKDKKYVFPEEESRIIPVKDTTAECLSEYILDEFVKSLKTRVESVELEVHEGPGQYAKSQWKQKSH